MQSLYGAIANTNKKEIMAVSVDGVYQKVLAIANKEQRGYITPQEFNLFADQAQMEIYEQYFYDISQFKRTVGNQSDYADSIGIIEDKLSLFLEATQYGGSVGTFQLPPNFYRISTLECKLWPTLGGTKLTAEYGSREEISRATYNSGPLLQPTSRRPVFYITQNNKVHMKPEPNQHGEYESVYPSYYVRPAKPNWTYVIDPTTQNALYNPTASDHKDFELHAAEETKLVINILQLAGINIKDYNLVQVAGQKEASIKQQEKQ